MFLGAHRTSATPASRRDSNQQQKNAHVLSFLAKTFQCTHNLVHVWFHTSFNNTIELNTQCSVTQTLSSAETPVGKHQ